MFISFVDSFLLLPIILRETDFSGVIYTTHVIADIAKCIFSAKAHSDSRSSNELTTLLRRLPDYANSNYFGYAYYSSDDVNRVFEVVYPVNFGEIIERDRTVSIQCISIKCGIPFCGWTFKPTYCLHPQQIDFYYIPFEGVSQSTLLLQNSNAFLPSSRNKCVGGQLAATSCDFMNFSDLYSFIHTAIDENHTIFVIGAITDTLVELTEGVLRGRASKGKALPIYYIDNEQGHYYSALTTYSRHPECCSEDIKKRIIGGFPPFLSFDRESKDIQTISSPTHVRSKAIYVIPDCAFQSLFPLAFVHPDAAVDVLLLSESFHPNTLKALFPDPARIHKVQCFTQPSTTIQPVDESIPLNDCTPYFVKMDARLLKQNASVVEKMSLKRSIDTVQGLNDVVFEGKMLQLNERVIAIDSSFFDRLKEKCIQMGYKEVTQNEHEIVLPEVNARIILNGNLIDIEVEGKNQDVIDKLYSICKSL